MRNFSGIYGIHNLINDKWYVGQAQNIKKRWYMEKRELILGSFNHNHNHHFIRAWKKYGKSAFVWLVLEVCPVDKLDERETFWIEQKDSFHNGYNQTLGGGGTRGYHFDDNTVLNISEKIKLKWKDEVYRKKMIQAYKNRPPVSDETRKKMSEHGKRMMSDPEYRKHISEVNKHNWANPEYRKKMGELRTPIMQSAEYRKKQSEANKRRWKNPEECQKKMSEMAKIVASNPELLKKRGEAIKRAVSSPEVRKKHSESSKTMWENPEYREKVIKGMSKPVLCTETSVIYSSIKEASEKTGIAKSGIGQCCRGQQKSAGGFHWRFVNDN